MRTFLMILLIFLAPSSFVWAAKVLKVKGSAHLQNVSGVFTLKKNDILKTGDIISTGKKSLIIITLNNGARLKLNQKSRIKIEDTDDAQVDLTSGSLFSKFNKKPKASLKVKTRSAVAGVRGTEFFTSYGGRGKKDDVWICVKEGVVDVKNVKTGKSVDVKQDEGVGVQKDKETTKPRRLAWTKSLNWNQDPESENLENTVDIDSAYRDLLDQDYD